MLPNTITDCVEVINFTIVRKLVKGREDTNAVSLNLFKQELQFLDESTHLR